jgi:hypothetical protein
MSLAAFKIPEIDNEPMVRSGFSLTLSEPKLIPIRGATLPGLLIEKDSRRLSRRWKLLYLSRSQLSSTASP